MRYHVLRIGHDEATDVASIRAGEAIDATSHWQAARKWLHALGEAYGYEHHDLVVMDEAGAHVTYEVETKCERHLTVHEHQCLDG